MTEKQELQGMAIQPRSFQDVVTLARYLQSADDMIPKDLRGKPGKILAAIMAGQELGVGPMASLRAFHVVEGKPTASSEFWIGRLKAAGYRLAWESSTERAQLTLTDPNGDTHVEVWDKERAVRAGLWNKKGRNGGNTPWVTHPEAMLRARCITSAGRAFAAEVMSGCYHTDEIEEIRQTSAEVTDTATQPAETTPGTAGLLHRVGAAQTEPEAVAKEPEQLQPQFAEEFVAAIEACDDYEECYRINEQARQLLSAGDFAMVDAAFSARMEAADSADEQ